MTREEAYLPAIHALHLAEVAARYGVTPSQLFAGLGLDPGELAEPERRIAIPVVERLIARAKALTGEPMIGWLVGVQMRISAHGYLGFAAMVAATIGDALDIACRFAPTRTNALELELVKEDAEAALVIRELEDMGTARDSIVIALVEGIRQIGHALTGQPLKGSAEFAFEQPPYFERLAEAAGRRVKFGRSENRIVFDRALLDVPLVMADPAAFRLATEQCERLLASIRDARRTTAEVRAIVSRRGGLSRSIDDVAAVMHVSSRTLKRHLAAEGTTFRDVLDEARRDEGVRLVTTTKQSFDAIADRLGYSDVANFTRAYRRWRKKTPGADRRST